MTEQKDPIEEFDFEKHKQLVTEQYQQIRPLYEEFANVVKNVISQALKAHQIRVHSIEARAKTLDSLGKKASTPSFDNPDRPKYLKPLSEFFDLSGVRVITFFPSTQKKVINVIEDEFDIIEKSDKTGLLIKEEQFGYASIYYVVKLKSNRADLLEYNRFKALVAEIQVRTILQHAWAEIEHDIQYKSTETIPSTIHRRFMSLAGLIEIGDREFQAIQDEDERLRKQAREFI